ncbi:virion structural protein [Pseudomonas phage 201phi2-1]|uniref:Virion structural protein n=1 Tax=Pseudomonas phage 201phi2-1 TaxID=198110 RepID=B3FJW4_BP201|nr:virion structural protein [Pseudomonas phage 201phi2-1]ABY63279.1 virion structural protein [Pseudomonas phage 201phi2-1]
MIDLMLSLVQKPAIEEDDSGLPFPAGTPFKGVVKSADFINGTSLAGLLGITAGTPINTNSGWLHFVEDNGYNIYIAKKPLRYGLTWEAINTGQTDKEIVIGGTTYTVQFMTGTKAANQPAVVASGGGQWDRYMYNIYGGELASSLPSTRLNWGSYTEKMLGIPLISEAQNVNTLPFGCASYTLYTSSNGGHATRGLRYPLGTGTPEIMGVWWGGASNFETHYGWRPMLVEKGTVPPIEETPYKGLIQPADLISPADLSTLLGITEGQIVSGAGQWMKFVENGKELYIAQKSFRSSIRKKTLDAAGVSNVAAGKLVTIGGKNYQCRLMTDAEWNRYMYSVYNNAITVVNTNFWAMYTPAELNVSTGAASAGTLSYIYGNPASTGTRGFTGIGNSWGVADWADGGTAVPGYGWRPVLELVP